MKKVNEITVLEANDPCALHEYSAQLEKDINKKFQDEKYDDTEIKQDILNIQEEQTVQNTKIEENSVEIATLKAENKRLQQENEDLRNAAPSGQANGENLKLEDSADMMFKKLGISGNTWQETRSGKNLTNYKDWTRLSAVGTLSITEDTLTYNVANGTYGVWDIERTLEANTAYTASWECNFSGTFGSPHGMKAKTGETWSTISTSNILNFTTDNTGKVQLAFYVGSPYLGENAILVLKNIRLYEGTYTANNIADYEKYGAMPSVEFQSQIRACGDDVNIFNKDDVEILNAYVENTENKIVSSNVERIIICKCQPNTTYTILKNIKTDIARFRIDCTNEKPAIGNNVTKLIYNTQVNKYTVKTTNDAKYLILQMYSEPSAETVTREQVLNSIKIVKGTEIKNYSSYNHGSMDFTICNKNLQKNEWVQENANRIMLDVSNVKAKIGDTITIWINTSDVLTTKSLYIRRTGISDLLLKSLRKKSDSIYYATITITEEILKYFNSQSSTLLVYKSDGVSVNNITSSAIEYGEMFTDYVEHKEQNYTIPLKQKLHKGDYLTKDGIHHKRAEIELDGITDRLKVSSVVKHTNDIYYCTVALSKLAINASSFYCSHLKNNTSAGVTVGNCYITGGGGILVLVLEDQTITTVEQANNWLAEQKTNGTPVVANYMLKEEELEEYSEEQKAIYDEIMQARSYKEKTHIFSNDEISPIFDVEYVKDTNIVINKMQAQILAN